MTRRSAVLGTLVVAMLVASGAQAKVRVVATVSDLGVIAREVGGDLVQVDILSKPTQDPHFVDAKPSLVLTVSRAQLLLLNGMELEIGWLPALLTSSRNAGVQPGNAGYLDCSALVTPREVPTQKLDRSMGDIHPGGNPHYSKDPRNAAAIADGIASRLAQLDPANAAKYQANAKKFSENLAAKIAEWKQQLAPYQGTPVVAYHKSWIYFTDFAKLVEVAFVEPKPGLQPSAAHVAAVMQVIRKQNVPIILQEEWYSAQTSELLASKTGAVLVRVPGMANENDTYAEAMGKIVAETVKGLAAKGK